MKQINFEQTGRLLRNYRMLKGLSIRQAAKAIYISHDSLYRYEQGTRVPSLQSLVLLAELYGRNLEDLIVYKDQRSPMDILIEEEDGCTNASTADSEQ